MSISSIDHYQPSTSPRSIPRVPILPYLKTCPNPRLAKLARACLSRWRVPSFTPPDPSSGHPSSAKVKVANKDERLEERSGNNYLVLSSDHTKHPSLSPKRVTSPSSPCIYYYCYSFFICYHTNHRQPRLGRLASPGWRQWQIPN